jgi:hypothetical protein
MRVTFSPAGPEVAVIAAVLFAFWLVGVTAGLVVAAVVLRSACHFARVPVPHFVKAMGVSLVEVLVILLLLAVNAASVGQVRAARVLPPTQFIVINAAVMAVAGLTAAAVLFTIFLRVGFGRALLIALIRNLIYALIVAMVVGILAVMGAGPAALVQSL